MDSASHINTGLLTRLKEFAPDSASDIRALALFSAAIATGEENLVAQAAVSAQRHGVTARQLYEVVLQSYLFLGFPRMLIAAEGLNRTASVEHETTSLSAPAGDEVENWFERGTSLCKKIYGETYVRLKDRVESMAPEVFQWMILEGYGKVLSRPGLDSIARELCIVSCLIMENRPAQLFSHMRGALNVGASPKLLLAVIEDLGEVVGPGYHTALDILKQLEAA